MPRTLLVSVRFHDGRYHGTGDWPPAPARLFQALVAGAARGEALAEEDRLSLRWLEGLEPPLIAAPAVRAGQPVVNYVPNNDLDAVGGDPRRIGEIRAPKQIRPHLFDAADAFLYVWNFEAVDGVEGHAQTLTAIAERLYQLGRGVDMAWAWAEIVEEDEAAARLARHGGALYRPGSRGKGKTLLCPQHGSLESLEVRFRASRKRFTNIRKGKAIAQIFSQPPKPRFRAVPYDSPPEYLLFDLRKSASDKAEPDFAPWPLTQTAMLVESIRDAAAQRLRTGLPEMGELIDRILIGRDATEADKAQRLRLIPLPSIGHVHAHRAIRRVLVEIPTNCKIPTADIAWAFSGLDLGIDPVTGEILHGDWPVLTRSSDETMLDHYGIDPSKARPVARVWRTVTPSVVPQGAARRRIDPTRRQDHAEWKGGSERIAEQRRAASAVIQALRHAGVTTEVAVIQVQREPFAGRGERAEAFAPDTRFAKERLWHVELRFAKAVAGPLVIGDGRYLGLGLMAPVREASRVIAFNLPSDMRVAVAARTELLRAVRRALMSLARREDDTIPPLFCGHEANGAPARSGRHRHIFLAGADLDGDGRIERLMVAAPWVCDPSSRPGRGEAVLFDRVVSSLETVRAGRLGLIRLRISGNDLRLLGPARIWESHIEYAPTRHAGRNKDAAEALLRDVVVECERRGLPRPEVELLNLSIGPRGGVTARLRLRFAVAVAGPILLGHDSHQGGGLFEAISP